MGGRFHQENTPTHGKIQSAFPSFIPSFVFLPFNFPPPSLLPLFLYHFPSFLVPSVSVLSTNCFLLPSNFPPFFLPTFLTPSLRSSLCLPYHPSINPFFKLLSILPFSPPPFLLHDLLMSFPSSSNSFFPPSSFTKFPGILPFSRFLSLLPSFPITFLPCYVPSFLPHQLYSLQVLGPGCRLRHGHEAAVSQDGAHDEQAEQRWRVAVKDCLKTQPAS